MTLLSKLGYSPIQKKSLIPPSEISNMDISIIVPVKNNQEGVKALLRNLDIHDTKPLEVIVVDNLSKPPLRIEEQYTFKVQVISCATVGPAAARNAGVSISKGKWLLFLDSDCIPTKTTISGYSIQNNKHIAYAGNIAVTNQNALSKYYHTQEILIPPKALNGKEVRPDYLVTANCLVWKTAFNEIGGFDEKFTKAGGEDIDLAFQLLTIGTIQYGWNSIVQHHFNDGLRGFIRRFIRYGTGNKQLATKYQLNLAPVPFIPVKRSFANYCLALVQFLCLSYGYHKHITNA